MRGTDGLCIERLVVGPLATNCYIVYCSESMLGFVIDPGFESERIASAVQALCINVGKVFLTHGHFDHTTDAEALAAGLAAEVYIHPEDAPLSRLDCELHSYRGGDKIVVDGIELFIIHTPGHTKGSVCISVGTHLFSGDTLFKHGIGRTDLPGGSFAQLMTSIKTRLLELPVDTIVYPGHGETTTIGEEAKAF